MARMLGGSVVKHVLELHGERRSIREIARTLAISRNRLQMWSRTRARLASSYFLAMALLEW
jgi:hypothetical protein